MRRTYRSKTGAGVTLDHREMLLTMDEKSSLFDAYYIQNIKQTKRELSSVGSSNLQGIVSKRDRRRKLVKRIVKDVESVAADNFSGTECLTPDKSIHVNKPLDPFDQLLNSSPATSEPKSAKKGDLFDKLLCTKPGKDYTRKKLSYIRKLNCSSSNSSGSEKENSEENVTNDTQNITDIRAEKFLIEKKANPSNNYNDSIENMAKKILMVNKMSRKSSLLCNNSLRSGNDTSIASSPLSSTPVSNKYRSKSIYKFSPIKMGDLEESPNYITIIEEDDNPNESVIFLEHKSIVPESESNKNSVPKSSSVNFQDNARSKVHSKPLFSSTDQDHSDDPGGSQDKAKSEETSLPENSIVKDSINIQFSSIHNSEKEPFLGFSINTAHKTEEDVDVNTNTLESSALFSDRNELEPSLGSFISKTKECDIKTDSQLVTSTQDDDKNNSSIVFTIRRYKSKKKGGSSTESECNMGNKSVSKMESCVSEVEHSIEPFIGFTPDDLKHNQSVRNNKPNVSNISSSDLEDKDSDSFEVSVTSKSEGSDTESSYNTCSESASVGEKRKPVVTLDRLNDSLFKRYYSKMPKRCDNSNSDPDSSDSSEKLESEGGQFLTNDNNSNFSNCVDHETSNDNNMSDDTSGDYNSVSDLEMSNVEESETTCISQSKLNNSDDEEKKCISFVTTRRRHDVKNCTILLLDDSVTSSNNSDCDKTVLSNKVSLGNENIRLASTESNKYSLRNNSIDELPNMSGTSKNQLEDVSESKVDKRNAFDPEKDGIILQPGKKWERSLSIYRRMTMADEHSLLEDEEMHAKGRKYRESVISTMEMQECSGSLHNETLHSRRSTFISKPSRSTIRIVKETINSRLSLSNTTVYEDLKGFIEDCDDTVVELSKLSISDVEHEVTVLEKFHETSRIATAKDFVLRRCNQSEVVLFDECYPDTLLKNCRKIGEGVYGEVFLWRAPDGRARVMKIVPIAGLTRVNGEQQKDYHEIISEIVIAMELSALRTHIHEIERKFDEGQNLDDLDLHSIQNATDVFNEVLAVKCVHGAYPSRLLDLWELYDETRGSENDNPAVLPPDQQYVVLELANAGQDLESYQFAGADQAHALLLQVAFGLAVAEESHQFEHRDLHWGNVLIAPVDEKYAWFVLRGRAHRVLRRGVRGTVIDYSLSRVSLAPATLALYNDLAADESLFSAVGDRQFEVYRLMRDALGNDWKNFEPYTNVLWLHYIVDKMITAVRYKRTNTKIHKQYINKLKEIKDTILSHGSAAQFVLSHNEY